MPIKPRDNESESEFVSRCIQQEMDEGTTDDPKQAAAICYSYWRNGGDKKSAMNHANNQTGQETHAALLHLVKSRGSRGQRFGQGIWTADKYVQSIAECVGPGICQRYFGSQEKSFAIAMKEAAGKLTFSGPDLLIDENSPTRVKLASGLASIKSVLGDVELPQHTMMAFVHTLTTPREDRDGDVLETAGAVLDGKMPLLWQHVHTLPVGRMLKVVEHSADRLKLAGVLLDINDLTNDAGKLLEANALRFSHGFRALDFSERNKEAAGAVGFRVKSYEIMEESLVSVPSNVDAEVELLSRGKLKSEVFKSHAKAMQRLVPKKHAGVAMNFGSFGDLKAAMDSGLINTGVSLDAKGVIQSVSLTVGTVPSGTDASALDDSSSGVTTAGSDHRNVKAGHTEPDADDAGGPSDNDQDDQDQYGYCPTCGAKGVSRQRTEGGGMDTCANGHTYPSADAKQKPKAATAENKADSKAGKDTAAK